MTIMRYLIYVSTTVSMNCYWTLLLPFLWMNVDWFFFRRQLIPIRRAREFFISFFHHTNKLLVFRSNYLSIYFLSHSWTIGTWSPKTPFDMYVSRFWLISLLSLVQCFIFTFILAFCKFHNLRYFNHSKKIRFNMLYFCNCVALFLKIRKLSHNLLVALCELMQLLHNLLNEVSESMIILHLDSSKCAFTQT